MVQCCREFGFHLTSRNNRESYIGWCRTLGHGLDPSRQLLLTQTHEKNKMKISLRIERNSIKASESIKSGYLLQAFSSDSSLQSGLSLQNNSFSIHSPLPHCNLPSGQTGSSVLKFGIALRGSLHFQCVYK